MIKVCAALALSFVGAVLWACCIISGDCSRKEEKGLLDSAFENEYDVIGY